MLPSFFRAGFLKLIADLLLFVSPAVQSSLLTWLQTPNAPSYIGYVATTMLFVAPILASLCNQHYQAYVLEGSMRVRTRLACASVAVGNQPHPARSGQCLCVRARVATGPGSRIHPGCPAP